MNLGDRMKVYERAARVSLPPRLPIIVRVDGKAFHTWTRGLRRPFSYALVNALNAAAVQLCEEIQGAQLAYVQSDEVSVLVHGYKRHASQAWFDGQLQKIVSVSAAIAAATVTLQSRSVHSELRAAYFDSRAFVLPEADVCNYFIWRQQDATRNSIQMHARSLYSHRECSRKNQHELREMIREAGESWEDLPTFLRRGRCVVREACAAPDGTQRHRWVVDHEPPVFSDARGYIERHLAIEPEESR